MENETPIPKVLLIRLAHAATAAGVSIPAFRAAIARKEIPLEPIRLGGITYFRASALAQWLNATNPDLFK